MLGDAIFDKEGVWGCPKFLIDDGILEENISYYQNNVEPNHVSQDFVQPSYVSLNSIYPIHGSPHQVESSSSPSSLRKSTISASSSPSPIINMNHAKKR